MLPKKNTQTLSTKQPIGLIGAVAGASAVGVFIGIAALSQSQRETVPAQAQAVTPIIANAAANLLQTNPVDSAITANDLALKQ